MTYLLTRLSSRRTTALTRRLTTGVTTGLTSDVKTNLKTGLKPSLTTGLTTALMIIALAVVAPVARAQACAAPAGGPPCPASAGVASNGAPLGTDVTVGNPVNPLTGNKYQDEIDAEPLPGPLGLEIRRHYNASYVADDTPWGRGWRLSYDTRLYRVGRSIQIIQADGRRLMFRAPDGVPVVGAAAACEAEQPGQGELVVVADGYRWVWPQLRELHFDAAGHLVRIAPVEGSDAEAIRIARDPDGRIREVIDPAARRMAFHYDRAGRLARIDHPLGTWTYRVGTEGQLLEVTAPDGSARRYGYDDVGNRTRMTSITDVDGDRSQVVGRWTYDSEGRVTGHVRADGSRLTLGYASLDDGDRETTVVDGLGRETRYRATEVGGQWQPVEIVGPGCDGCGPGNLRMRYDTRGRLVARWSIGGDGQGYRYDAAGRLIEIYRLDAPDRAGLHPGVERERAGARARRVALLPRAAIPAGPWLLRYGYAEAVAALPVTIDRPSVVPGSVHRLRYERDARGRPLRLVETGYAPVAPVIPVEPFVPIEAAAPVTSTGTIDARPLERELRWHYAEVGGRSLVVRIDAPLGGPTLIEPDPLTGLDAVLRFADGSVRRITGRDAGGRILRTETDDGRRRIVEQTELSLKGPALRLRRSGWLLDETGLPVAGSEVTVTTERRIDSRGREIELRDNAGRRQYREHDARGRVAGIADSRGYRSMLTRDAEGRVTRVGLFEPGRDEPLRAAYYRHDAEGRLVASVLPDGTWTRALIEDGRVVGTVDADRVRLDPERLALDSGRVAAEPGRVALDPGRIARDSGGVVLDSGRHRGPLADGRLEARPEGRARIGKAITLDDDFGRRVIEYSPDHGLRTYRHDAADRLVAATDGSGATIHYRYDSAGRLESEQDDNGVELSTRRHDGSLLIEVDDGEQRRQFRHDALGRLVETRTAFRSEPERWHVSGRHLDPVSGLVDRIRLADGSTLRFDRASVEDGAAITAATWRSRRWNQVAETMARWLPRGVAARIEPWLPSRSIVDSITLHPFQGLTGWRSGNGVTTRREHDRAGRLTALDIRAQGAVVDSLAYRYGIGPRIAAIDRGAVAIAAGATVAGYRFGYDGFGQLRGGSIVAPTEATEVTEVTEATGPAGADSRGGGFPSLATERAAISAVPLLAPALAAPIRSWPGPAPVPGPLADPSATDAGIRSPRASAGRPTKVMSVAATVALAGREVVANGDATGLAPRDRGGRLLADTRFRYRYSVRGQLTEVRRIADDGVVARYGHDAQGRRISKTVIAEDGAETVTRFLWDEGRIAAEIDGAGQVRRQFIYLEAGARAEPVALITTGSSGDARIDFVHADHRGAPFAVTDPAGRTVWRAVLSPTGNAWAAAEAPAAPPASAPGDPLLRLPGQYLDRETGLFDNGQRTYDPITGRYLQPDPLGYPDGPDPWLYAGGDPINRIDPTGLYGVSVHYYMTFFLAIAAGHSVEDARRIATAAQYVDDNPLTHPVNPNDPIGSIFRNHQQLIRYHFVLSGPDGVTIPAFQSPDVGNNQSPQLGNLWNAANYPGLSRESGQVLFGEYLHALADTYSHRDRENYPINAWRFGCGIGHGFFGHQPDYTHDTTVIGFDPRHLSDHVMPYWTRSARTFEMERAVYDALVGFGPDGGTVIAWERIEVYLTQFNRLTGEQAQIEFIRATLREWGVPPNFEDSERYSRVLGEIQRVALQEELARLLIGPGELPGVCLPGGTTCVPY